MESLPVEIFDLIVAHLTLTDWKCLRLTCRTIYSRLSTFASYCRGHAIVVSPKSFSDFTLLDRSTLMKGTKHLSLSNFNCDDLKNLLETSESFRFCLKQLTSLSFADSTTLIDVRLFYDLLSYCISLEKLDLSNYKFFFLSNCFPSNLPVFTSIKRLNLNGNTHLSDYTFNRFIKSFPNIEELHLLNMPLRSFSTSNENRTFLTFETIYLYFQNQQEHFRALSISFDPLVSCDTQIKRLFINAPPKLTYFHVDGTLNISTLQHFLLLLDDQLETLIIGRLQLDRTGCEPLFTTVNEYATNLKRLCIFLNTPSHLSATQYEKIHFPVLNQSSDISLSSLAKLQDLDIQTLYPLNETDLKALFGTNLKTLKKLALPRNATDDVIKHLCTESSCALSLTHLNLSNCLSLSDNAVLLINKYLLSLEELILSYNVNINDFAFIGLSICGIGKTIEWPIPVLISQQFIDDLPIWTYTITHKTSCKCQLPKQISSMCIKLRLKDFTFNGDEHSERMLSLLIEHELFSQYFYSINRLRNLKTLKLRQCVHVTNRLFRFGLRSLPNMKTLDISLCEKINDTYLSCIGRACPSIEIIDISGCHRITDQGKEALKATAKRVKLVDF